MADKELRDPRADAEGQDQQALQTAESTESNQPSAKDVERGLGRAMLVKVALASVLVASLIISIVNLMVANQLRDQTDEYRNEIDAYKEKISRLKYYINKEVDDEYIVEYAREYLDMYFPDEEIYYNDVNE